VTRFLLQMDGEAGTGKSTMARAIGEATGAVVIDKDVIKSVLLEEGLPDERAGGAAHAVSFALCESFLRQGFSVVLDSAAFFTSIRDRGQAMASRNGAAYRIILCALTDRSSQAGRLRSRAALPSQPLEVQHDRYSRPGTAVLTEPHLLLDTSARLESYLPRALAYIGHGQS